MKQAPLSILIPAAGASNRLGQAKQLLQYQGSSLLQHAVNSARFIDPREIIVVTGAGSKAVRSAVEDPSVRWIHNPHWSAGLGGSIAMGAASIDPESVGLMILLCDQWRLQKQDLRVLAETWWSDPSQIVVAKADGQYMPPVIFPSACFSQLQALQGHQGARNLFKTHPGLLTPIAMQNAATDLDTISHLDKLP